MRRNNKRILITGATGFLGRHLAGCLIREGNEVCLTSGHDDKKSDIRKMDLNNLKLLKQTISQVKPDIIYHTGALVNLTRDFSIGKKCLKINLGGTYNLLESLRHNPPSRFIFTSTEEVYGDGKIPYCEDQLLCPPSPYATSKIAAEYLCNIYAHELDFSLIIFRIGTMYGPGQTSRFIPGIISQAIRNDDIFLNSGTKKRDYVYISDVGSAMRLAMDKEFPSRTTILNIGGGVSYSLKEVVDKIIYISKSKSKILTGKLPERRMEASEWLMDNSKAEKLLGWKPKISLEEGLKITIDYLRKRSKAASGDNLNVSVRHKGP